MHTINQKNVVLLAKEFQQHLTKENPKNGVIDQGKCIKRFMERKWTDIQHHIQDNAVVSHKDVKNYCNTNQFPVLSFCGPYSKPHGARGVSKHYRLRLYPKLGNSICAILCIPCACVAFSSMIYKPWISDTPSNKEERYKLVTKCIYWSVLGSFNNWNIIQFLKKPTPYEEFDEIHQVVIDGISDNIASLV